MVTQLQFDTAIADIRTGQIHNKIKVLLVTFQTNGFSIAVLNLKKVKPKGILVTV